MTKHEVKKLVFEYLRQHAIPYKFLYEVNKPISFDSSDTIYLCVDIPNVIGKHIETCVRFRDEYLYCQSYYCCPVVEGEEQAIRAARIVNYLNMNLGYDCNSLYDHVFVFDEENGDIFNGCLLRYSLVRENFQESMDHILNFSVQQLVDVCPYVLGYIIGEFTYFQATKIGIDHKLMGKSIPGPED